MSNSHTWNEITSQPQAWQETLVNFDTQKASLADFAHRAAPDQVLVIGCGSTHYLAQFAAATIAHCAGIPALALPSSELWLYANIPPATRPLLLAVSRSGTTTETLWAVERFKRTLRPGTTAGAVLAVTCYPESTLARQADFVLAAAAQEQSVAQTRSFTSMAILTQAVAALLSGNEKMLDRLRGLPDALADLISRFGDLPQQLGENLELQRIFYLGGGPLYGLANEAMLKTKEMSLSYAEAYHPLEFRHGPMSMVDEHTLVVGLLSDAGLNQELQVLQDMQKLGGRTLALIENSSQATDTHLDEVIELRSGLSEWERGALYLPIVQRLAYYRAIAKGLNPDQPHNLKAVVEL